MPRDAKPFPLGAGSSSLPPALGDRSPTISPEALAKRPLRHMGCQLLPRRSTHRNRGRNRLPTKWRRIQSRTQETRFLISHRILPPLRAPYHHQNPDPAHYLSVHQILPRQLFPTLSHWCRCHRGRHLEQSWAAIHSPHANAKKTVLGPLVLREGDINTENLDMHY